MCHTACANDAVELQGNENGKSPADARFSMGRSEAVLNRTGLLLPMGARGRKLRLPRNKTHSVEHNLGNVPAILRFNSAEDTGFVPSTQRTTTHWSRRQSIAAFAIPREFILCPRFILWFMAVAVAVTCGAPRTQWSYKSCALCHFGSRLPEFGLSWCDWLQRALPPRNVKMSYTYVICRYPVWKQRCNEIWEHECGQNGWHATRRISANWGGHHVETVEETFQHHLLQKSKFRNLMVATINIRVSSKM